VSKPKRFLLVPDKFKGSLTAEEVMQTLHKGIQDVFPQAEIHSILASDGGDGFLNAVAIQVPCETIFVDTVDPLGRQIRAGYLYDVATKNAYVELASASGLELLSQSDRRAIDTSTFGTGLQIKDALSKGARSIYIGLGGSATNEAALGIANALGYRFVDKAGNQLAPVGRHLNQIATIDATGVSPQLNKVQFFAVNDVDNPLFGLNGAAAVYAGQKGASDAEIVLLDKGLRHLAGLVSHQLGKDVADVPGSGAAGGAAYGLKVFFDGKFVSGTDFMLDLAKAESQMMAHPYDLILTGEGKFDQQTMNGKLIKGVTALGKRCGVPVVAVCGKLELQEQQWKTMGLRHVIEIQEKDMAASYSMANAAQLIRKKVGDYLALMDR
jgi:glycerate kinase